MSKFGISMVLPVLNEAKNLEYFIPKFAQVIESRIGNDLKLLLLMIIPQTTQQVL